MRPHLDVRMEEEALAQLGALDPKRDPTSALPYCDNNNKDKEKRAHRRGMRKVGGRHIWVMCALGNDQPEPSCPPPLVWEVNVALAQTSKWEVQLMKN